MASIFQKIIDKYKENEFEAYKNNVNYFIETNSPLIFGNYSQEHAFFIIQRFVSIAKKTIILLSGSLYSDFYNKMIQGTFEDAAQRLKRDNQESSIRILTLDGKKDPPDWISNIKEKDGKTLEYRTLSSELTKIYHFLIIDGMRYRLEEPHDKLNEQKKPYIIKAEVCCNDKLKSRRLTDYFEELWHKASINND